MEMSEHMRRFSSIFSNKTEAVFLLLLSLYTYVSVLNDSLLNLSSIIRPLRYGVTIVCILLFLFRNRKKPSAKKMLFAAVILAAFMIAGRATGRNYLIVYAALIIAADGCDTDKAVRAWLISTVLALLTILILCVAGIIPDYYGDGKARHYLGFSFYSYFPFLVFYCIIAYIYGKKDKVRIYHYAIVTLVNILTYYLTALYLTFFLAFFFILFDLLLVKAKKLDLNKKPIMVLSMLAFPLGAFVTLFVMAKYNPGDARWLALNTMLHSRPGLMHQGFLRYPLSLFGNRISMLGYSALRTVLSGTYFYIDSGFAYSLLGYGLIFTFVVVALYTILFLYSCRTNNKHLFAWLTCVLIFTMMNNTWVDVYYNPVLLFSFAAFREFDKWEGRERVLLITIEAAGLVGVAVWLIPWFRTLGDASVGGHPKMAIFAAVLIGLILLGLALSFGDLLLKLLQHQRPESRRLAGAGVLLFCCACGILAINGELNRMTAKNLEKLEPERSAVETVQQVADCQLLVDGPEEVYRRAFGGIGHSFYRGNNLTALSNVAYITDVKNDFHGLIQKGYKYTEISEEHAIYTNSPEAEAALRDAGYHLTGFYSHECVLNLDAVSRVAYGKPLSQGTGIDLLEKGAVARNVSLALPASPYKAVFELVLHRKDDGKLLEPDDVIAILKVVTEDDARVIAEREVCCSDFDRDDPFSAELDFEVTAATDVVFLIELAQELNESISSLLLQGIHYRQSPAYDRHAYYDVNERVLFDEFYDLDGNPIIYENGAHAREYAYDRYGNITSVRYLDLQYNPVINKSGFAEAHKKYNNKQQLINEEYFDEFGRPINIGAGYASVTSEYDEAGNLARKDYYDTEGNKVPCGSGYFHEYLTALADKENTIVFFSIKDEGTAALTPLLLSDLHTLGIKTNLKENLRSSFLAVVNEDAVIEKVSADSPVYQSGIIEGMEYFISSASLKQGNYSSIIIDGSEYSKNVRGMNIVVVCDGVVIDSVAFDTYDTEMRMVR